MYEKQAQSRSSLICRSSTILIEVVQYPYLTISFFFFLNDRPPPEISPFPLPPPFPSSRKLPFLPPVFSVTPFPPPLPPTRPAAVIQPGHKSVATSMRESMPVPNDAPEAEDNLKTRTE